MKSLLLVMLISFPVLLFAQQSFSGKIIDAKTKQPIPFATIGLLKQNTGTNSYENGTFKFSANRTVENDSFFISCFGYVPKKIAIADKTENLIIELTENEVELQEVVVNKKNTWNATILNDFHGCGNHFITSSGYITQIAQHFYTPEKGTILSAVKICNGSMAMLYKEKAIFRIRIYDMNKTTGAPGKDLCKEIIEIKTGRKNTVMYLRQYNIHIPENDFFIAIEWLKILYNENKSAVRAGAEKKEYISYRPSIGWSDAKDKEVEAWHQDYTGKWSKIPELMRNGKTSLSIAATVQY